MKKRILIVLFVTIVVLFSNNILSWAQLNVVNDEEKQLTIDPSGDGTPKWNSDGTKIVFRSGRSGNTDIWVMNADGSNQTQLTTALGHDAHPDWSPDGSKIVFHSNRTGNNDIWIMNTDGTNQMQLTSDSAGDAHPNYNADGTKIAFQSNRAGSQDIWVMNSDGTNLVQLTTGLAQETHLSWSPDGTKIAYDSNISGNWDIWVMNADGSDKTQLTTNLANDKNPDWSSDGFQIVFDSNRSGNQDIWTMILSINAPGKIVGWGGYNYTSFFNFNIFSNGLYPIGAFYYSDRARDINLWSNQITGLMISSDKKKAAFKGNVKIGGVAGYKFVVYVNDNGNPGTNDKFRMKIYDPANVLVYISKGTLFTGNIQIYP
ncbi:MAG: PD40 domain-containing protein [Actinobacteria bacterium]|nr:PD40 domain-containing protein [Actinomycetota bacterium]